MNDKTRFPTRMYFVVDADEVTDSWVARCKTTAREDSLTIAFGMGKTLAEALLEAADKTVETVTG